MSGPFISVITVVRNDKENLRRTIENVLAQSCQAFEYLVIDGGSTDGTTEVARAYQDRLACLISEPDRGIYDAMNKGIARANGMYVHFMNAGDFFYDETVLKDLSGALFRNPADIVYGDTMIVYPGGFKRRLRGRKTVYELPAYHQAMLFSRKVLTDCGMFNTRLRYGADLDLWQKALGTNGCRLQYYPGVVSVNNLEGFSNRNYFAVAGERARIYAKNLSGLKQLLGYGKLVADCGRFALIYALKALGIYEGLIRWRYSR